MLERISQPLTTFGRTTLDLFFPPICAGCGAPLASEPLCDECRELIAPVASPRCPFCGTPFDGAGDDHPCGRCLEAPPPFTSTSATFRYAGAVAEGVVAVKYGGRVERIDPLSRLWRDACGPLPEVDLAVPVPLHPSKLRRRGFNQSVLLSKPLLRSRGVRLRCSVLARVEPGTPQAGLTRAQRLRAPRGLYALTPRGTRVIEGRRVLLLDDIMTTSATNRWTPEVSGSRMLTS